MFEQVEAHVERMLALVSENERKQNPVLKRFEKRMGRVLLQLKELAEKSKPKIQAAKEETECSR